MPFDYLSCPRCGGKVKDYRNPLPTVDMVIEVDGGIVLIERKNEPYGWALPGGFVDYGEAVEAAAVREAKEETGLELGELHLLGVYSDPSRDPRHHTITITFVARGSGIPCAADDAASLQVFPPDRLPAPLCFDHAQILKDYLRYLERLRAPAAAVPEAC